MISKLRWDADLRYLYTGPRRPGKGRPWKYDGKIDCKTIDKSRFKLCYHDDDVKVYSAVVNSKSLKRDIKIAYVKNEKTDVYANLFSTDTEIDGYLIYRYYKARFQIEFLFRDAKQHTGLNNSQARSVNKLYFHFCTSLSSVSIAKAEYLLKNCRSGRTFSMCDVKSLYSNKLFLDTFFAKSGLDQSSPKIADAYEELLNFGKIAA